MSYEDELDEMYCHIKHKISYTCCTAEKMGTADQIEKYHNRALEIVTELENTRRTAWKASNAQYAIIARAQDEARELRTKLESKNKTLTLVVQALAETIGEEER